MDTAIPRKKNSRETKSMPFPENFFPHRSIQVTSLDLRCPVNGLEHEKDLTPGLFQYKLINYRENIFQKYGQGAYLTRLSILLLYIR